MNESHVLIDVVLEGASPLAMNRAAIADGAGAGYSACKAVDVETEVYGRLFLDDRGQYYLPSCFPVIAISNAAARAGLRRKGKRKAAAMWPIEYQDAIRCAGLVASECRLTCGRTPRRVGRSTTLVAGAIATWCYPVFDEWSVKFRLRIETPRYDVYTVHSLLTLAGEQIGLPQFAPFIDGGEWGRFSVSKWEEA